MRIALTIASPHKAARFAGWLRLWLSMLVAHVGAHWCAWFAPHAQARDLDRVARAVMHVVFVGVCARMGPPPRTG